MTALKRVLISTACFAGLLVFGSVISGSREDGGVGGIAAAAPAKEKEAKGPRCSERTVKGVYAFALQGNVQGVGPMAASGTTTLDGVSQIIIKGFINTTTGDPVIEANLVGTYTVDPEDCTASATLNIPSPGVFGRFTEIRFEAEILKGGEEIRYVITTPGIVFAGSTARQN